MSKKDKSVKSLFLKVLKIKQNQALKFLNESFVGKHRCCKLSPKLGLKRTRYKCFCCLPELVIQS